MTSFVELQPELAQDRTRLDHRARTVGEALVPGGRQAEHHPGIAGAERADDHVVLGRVFSTTTRLPPPGSPSSAMAEPSWSKRALKAGSTQARATTLAPQRADVPLVLADPLVDGLGREQPLLDQERLQRLRTKGDVGFLLRVVRHRSAPFSDWIVQSLNLTSPARSGLEIAFPQIERDRLPWLGGRPPELEGSKRTL